MQQDKKISCRCIDCSSIVNNQLSVFCIAILLINFGESNLCWERDVLTVRAVLTRLRAVSIFFANLVRGVHARASVDWRSRETRETSEAAREEKVKAAPVARANEFCVRLTTQKCD